MGQEELRVCKCIVSKLRADLKELAKDPSGFSGEELERELELIRKSIKFWENLAKKN